MKNHLRAFLQLDKQTIFESELSFIEELKNPGIRQWIYKDCEVKDPVLLIGDPEDKKPICKFPLKEKESKTGKLIFSGHFENSNYFVNCNLTPGKSVNRPGFGLTVTFQELTDSEVSLPRGWK